MRRAKRSFRRVSGQEPGYPTMDLVQGPTHQDRARGGCRALLAGALTACVTGLGFFGGCMPMPRAALDQAYPPQTQQVVRRDGGAPVQLIAQPDAGGVLMVVPPEES